MLIRKRLEKLERTSPPTIPRLIDRIEREAMNALTKDQQRLVGTRGGEAESVNERYQEALASALKQVSDEDLNRMILFYEPTADASTFQQ